MTSAWKECLLGDVVTLKRGYDLPHRDRIDGNVPIVTSSGITGYHNIAKAKGPGVVTGRYGTLGEVYYVREDYWPHNTTLYVRDFKGNDPLFVSYFLKTLHFSTQNVAGAVPGVNRNYLHMLKVKVPPLPIQHKIAAVLSAYDDLIEVNTRRIRLLEEMAQAVYREWFGSLDAGSLPEGWEVKLLGDIIEFKNGKAIKVEDDGDFPVYGSNGIIGRTNEARYRNAIVIGRVGAYCGSINYCLTQFSATDNTIIASPSKSSGIAENFAYRLLQNMNLRRYAGGAAQPLLTQTVLKKLTVLVPPISLCDEYEEIAEDLFGFQTVLEKKNANLRRTRDLLLPRLVSGEVGVEQIELELET